MGSFYIEESIDEVKELKISVPNDFDMSVYVVQVIISKIRNAATVIISDENGIEKSKTMFFDETGELEFKEFEMAENTIIGIVMDKNSFIISIQY